ncbi:MAG: AraC family transcriptional regulator [Saprospiraceae bacterium]|nr:AraC family transcriptional regulator [Saprospiraceae bacterium]
MHISDLAKLARQQFGNDPPQIRQIVRPVSGLILLRYTQPTELEATLYEPVICLILQGRKTTMLGNRRVALGPGESLIVSHDLPVVSQVTRASMAEPYLAMILTLDLGMLRSLYAELGGVDRTNGDAHALQGSRTDPKLMDALARYLDISHRPTERHVLGPLYLREIHFRLLMAPHGGMLRKLLRLESSASQITRAIAWIRQHYKESILVPELAKEMGMSVSSFHKYFKEITATSPLQYQKTLRLLEARRLLTAEALSVAETAFRVGYESPTQFSREYTRKFGSAPSRDRLEPVMS